MAEIEEKDKQRELLKQIGRGVEKKALLGEPLMNVGEVKEVRDILLAREFKLDGIKRMGDMDKQANRVLEAVGGYEHMDDLVQIVESGVRAVIVLNGGEVADGSKEKINQELLTKYIREYLENTYFDGGFQFPLNADLGKIVKDEDFFEKYSDSGIDLQKVGFRIEVVLSVLNRLMYACGAGTDEEIEFRLNDDDFVHSIHGLPNRIFRGYERAGMAEEIKVDIAGYGDNGTRKKIRHCPIGGVSAILGSLV